MHVSDELYAAIAGNLYWELKGRSGAGWVYFPENRPLQTDTDAYTDLTGKVEATWETVIDIDGRPDCKLRDVNTSGLHLTAYENGDKTPNDFNPNRLYRAMREYFD